MPLYLNGNAIGDLYIGGTKISEAWLNGQQVYTSVPSASGINYIFRDIDADGRLNLATGALDNADAITKVGANGLKYAFFGCTNLTGVASFPALTTVEENGMAYTFYQCSGITGVSFPELVSAGSMCFDLAFASSGVSGKIYFPKLTDIGYLSLRSMFRNCTGITEVHFKSSMSGHEQCTASNMECTNATVYFDL